MPATPEHLPGRPKTDKLDAVWLARLTERGMLRPSFVPPAELRQLRDYTRLRLDLTRDRSRQVQRLEKLLEDALIKLSTVATDIMGVSGRAMLEALIAGQRDPRCSPSWPGDGCAASVAPWCRRFTAASMTTTPCWRGCCWTTTTP
jgi:hypothetical protein